MRKPLSRILLVHSCLAIGAVAPVAAQEPGARGYHDDAKVPDGVIGERVRSFVEMFNEGTHARFEAFLQDEVTEGFRDLAPESEHWRVLDRARRQWGSVAFHSIRTYDPPRLDQTVVIVRDSISDAWRAVVFSFDADDGYRISGLRFNDARPPSGDADPEIGAGDLLLDIAGFVATSCEVDVFSGAVLVAEGEEVLYSHACGEASKRFHALNNLQTKFNLGSMNKMFTSVAIMQLVERGLVSVEDPISRYVDETWLRREVTERITVHHLLTHTSGLGSYFNDAYWESSRELFRALDDYKPLIRGEEPVFEPGAGWAYSNTGMFLLGVVIERATGEDYFDYIRANIYEPAGMVHSDSYEMDRPIDNLAIGYDPVRGGVGYENNLYKHVIKGGPAGGGFSTVEDLHRFALALQDGSLLSAESLGLLWTDHADAGYGYGFGIKEIDGVGRVVGHGGGFPGLSANLDIMLERGLIVIVMSNYGGGASPIAGGISDMIARVEARDD